ncbi:MAG: helix-hairpin-helix domain-containing protein [Proteobacteria bacterium]|nr:helix-hairpin-helix domain-containing protein [Pseudomonadota bacterium]
MYITKGQLRGATVVILITTFLYFGRPFFHHFHPPHNIEKNAGSVVVELAGDTDYKGIYFLPPKPTVSDLFRIARVPDIRRFDEKYLAILLDTGRKVVINSGQVKIKEIDAAKRIVLDIPIDINSATTYDLTLIPGIGKKTAQAIVKLREEAGRIAGTDDLLKITGMGEKKLGKIKKYLYIRNIDP